jgi:hypothetical protein
VQADGSARDGSARDGEPLAAGDDPVARGETAADALADDGGRPADHGLRPRSGRVSQGYGE